MGIEPFLLSSTLELIVAQRLVRQICDNCKSTYTLSEDEVRRKLPLVAPYLKGKKEVTLYRGTGCQVCNGTGYRGRTGIFELIRNTPEMQDLIVARPKRSDIWKLARSQGSRPLFEDGFEKVTEGVTTLDELLRVAEPEEVQSS
jgi:type II secretory ATPase GspE/PulE/Tfp pilus assembly ATPase PilB-like protein